MILVMTLLARDEEDIVRENIEYHKSQGVDYFIATDNASRDGTTQILKEYERKGILKYIREDGVYHQSKWVTRMARIAYKEYGANWIINNDADEFWWPTLGSLRSTLDQIPKQYGAVRAIRHNLLLNSEETKEVFYKRMIYRREVSLNPIGRPLPPKVCHRGVQDIEIGPGSHIINGDPHIQTIEADITIYHYPVRNFNQLSNKTINIGSGYEKNPQTDEQTGLSPGIAQKTIYAEYKKNPTSLEKYFKENQIDPEQIPTKLKSGEILEDSKLSKYLSTLMSVN